MRPISLFKLVILRIEELFRLLYNVPPSS